MPVPGTGGSGSGDPGHRAWCKTEHGFLAAKTFGSYLTATADPIDADDADDAGPLPTDTNCPDTKCGLNGAWLGRGLPFRTLHLDHTPNEQHLAIFDFQDKHNVPMTLEVEGDVLRGRVKPNEKVLEGNDLIHSQLLLIETSGADAMIVHSPTPPTCDPWNCGGHGRCVDGLCIYDDANGGDRDGGRGSSTGGGTGGRGGSGNDGGGGNGSGSGSDGRGSDGRGSGSGSNGPTRNMYRLTIIGYEEKPFWADCAPGTPCPTKAFPVYQFTATSLKDDCEVELCAPGLNDDNDDEKNGAAGKAVIFRGDLYDEKSYKVKMVTPSDNGEGAIFNIACLGTATSKLHLLRHTSASAHSDAHPTVGERQTMLRLFTADYCGIGHPFTQNGLPLRFGFNNQYYTLNSSAGYDMSDAVSIDARWNQDGATCIGMPRLLRTDPNLDRPHLVELIRKTCLSNARPSPPDCDTSAAGTTRKADGPNKDYAISGNPKISH